MYTSGQRCPALAGQDLRAPRNYAVFAPLEKLAHDLLFVTSILSNSYGQFGLPGNISPSLWKQLVLELERRMS